MNSSSGKTEKLFDWIVVESTEKFNTSNCTKVKRMPNIKVFSGSSHPDLAAKVTDRLGTFLEHDWCISMLRATRFIINLVH